MHFERQNAFQNAENYIFCQKKNDQKRYVCLPYLKFSDPLPETHLFLYLALLKHHRFIAFTSVQSSKIFDSKIRKTFLPINLNMCLESSKEPSHFEYLQQAMVKNITGTEWVYT